MFLHPALPLEQAVHYHQHHKHHAGEVVVDESDPGYKEPGKVLGQVPHKEEGGSSVLFLPPQVYHVEGGRYAQPPHGGVAKGADAFPEASFFVYSGDNAGVVPYGALHGRPFVPGGGKVMGGLQAAVVFKHGPLVVDHPAKEPSVTVVPEGQVGQQVDQGGDGHKEHQAEADGLPGMGEEAFHNMFVLDSFRPSGRVFLGVQVFPVSAEQHREKDQGQSHSRIDPRPLAGHPQPHAQTAGPQGDPGLFQGSVIKACLHVLVHKIVH